MWSSYRRLRVADVPMETHPPRRGRHWTSSVAWALICAGTLSTTVVDTAVDPTTVPAGMESMSRVRMDRSPIHRGLGGDVHPGDKHERLVEHGPLLGGHQPGAQHVSDEDHHLFVLVGVLPGLFLVDAGQ